MASCNSDLPMTQDYVDTNGVPVEVLEAMHEMYPEAKDVRFSNGPTYTVAKFKGEHGFRNSYKDAWFGHKGHWRLTVNKIDFEALPDPVKEAFAATEYADWTVVEVKMMERPELDPIYEIEAETVIDGIKSEVELIFSADGVLAKVKLEHDDDDSDHVIPTDIRDLIISYVTENYPEGRILEVEYEHNCIEVEVLNGDVKLELFFDLQGNFLSSKEDEHNGKHDDFDDEDDDDDDHHGDKYDRNPKIDETIAAFIADKYPGAVVHEVERMRNGFEVEIKHEKREKELLFSADKVWQQTKWEVRIAELPEAVTAAIAASEYASDRIDDIDYIETPAGAYYLIEFKGHGHKSLRVDL